MHYSFQLFFCFSKLLSHYERFVAMLNFFGILIEVKYLRDLLPFPTLPVHFLRFGVTSRLGRVLRYFLLFFWWDVLFSSTRSPWSTSVFLFSNSTISARCISKSSKHSSGIFALCESDFNSFKSSRHEALPFWGNTSLVFHQNHQIYCQQHASHLFDFTRLW